MSGFLGNEIMQQLIVATSTNDKLSKYLEMFAETVEAKHDCDAPYEQLFKSNKGNSMNEYVTEV